MLYDTHAHVNFSEYPENYRELIKKTLAGDCWFNNIGTHKADSAEAVSLANEFGTGIFAVVGLHPTNATDPKINEKKFDYEFYKKLAEDPKVVGIGECGLDYYRIPEGSNKEQVRAIQAPVFKEQIRLAKEMNKALVIHVRASAGTTDAYDDTLEVLRAEGCPERLVIHSFTGDWLTCQKFLELGAYVAFNGIITFDKTGVLAEVVKNCPLNKIVLETDAPYLAPVPFRGKKNEPMYVAYTAQKIAELKGLSLEEVSDVTTANARSLFQV